ncbi:peptidase domain-containing ABC transporter [Pseudoduganella armeniaca]|uniref:Cyclolysin secretion/processing ATP-binding protein CyaB n=1 Tax=Pseudoduganella armeniaca TaxID=2072590 RepID=A0A2R4CGL1_9BURK|nr:peptidase domain-containing ABC transporter [Pseudoduganella armeniaca]AVR98803.1 ABC transporter [Pseudoduganella armeniaca]
MKTVLQSEQNECGLACLAMIASHFGNHTDLAALRTRFSISLKGATLAQLMRHAGAMGLSSRPLRLEVEEIGQLRLPCILHWDLNHFVVLKKAGKTWRGRQRFVIVDPAVGERTVGIEEVQQHFTGVALELIDTPAFEKSKGAPALTVRQLAGRVRGLGEAVSIVVVLALVLEIFTIVSPLFNQFVIDEVIVSGDTDLLLVLVIGFAFVLVSQTLIGLARSWLLMKWNVNIGLQWTTRVFSHLLRLPASYFEKRHLGDLISRFGSIGAIQGTLNSLFVTSMLDGLMAVLALVMMAYYSWKLSAIVAAAALLYSLVRWIAYYPGREAARERLLLSAKENTHFIETLRAIVPLKLYGRETERLARWVNLKQDVINRDIRTQKIGICFQTLNTAIGGAQTLLLFYFGAHFVIDNAMTVGMLMAFNSYAGTFSTRVFSLIDLVVNLRMLSMHTERLADIVTEAPEAQADVETDLTRFAGAIELRGVKFRYAEGEPWILDDVNLVIRPGESVAFVGPSGGGKTTLCKLLLGLLSPTEGEVLIDGVPIARIGLAAYRRLIGAVMQEDALLRGSIFDNITFFDTSLDAAHVTHCAQLAAIHDEINRMPMGYQTLIGDLGSGLSGGQRQRVLLARALYKQPRILVLDEATSHLDIGNEAKVNAALAGMNLTRIMVAHRPETIRSASRIVEVSQKKVSDLLSEDAATCAVAA